MNKADLEQLVFERNEFQCQLCHRQVPSVLLLVDNAISSEDFQIEPPEDGYYCLCESCYKQQHGHFQTTPTSRASDRRKQLDMLISWRQERQELSAQIDSLVIDYVNGKIEPLSLNKTGQSNVHKAVKSKNLTQVLDAIDEMFDQYVRYGDDDEITKRSANEFINKLGGYLYITSLSPVEQAVYYVRNVCRKMYANWNDLEGKKLLNEYVEALRRADWTDEEIISDLKKELMRESRLKKNWTTWSQFISKWISDIKGWKTDNDDSLRRSGLTNGKFEHGKYRINYARHCYATFEYLFSLVAPKDHIRRIRLCETVKDALQRFLTDQQAELVRLKAVPKKGDIESIVFDEYLPWFGDTLMLQEDEPETELRDLPFDIEGPHNGVFFSCIKEMFEYLYLPALGYDYQTCLVASQFYLDHIDEVFCDSLPF